MNKLYRTIAASVIILAGIGLSAQEGIKDIHPANPQGKMLTMEDVILKRTAFGALSREFYSKANEVSGLNLSNVIYPTAVSRDGRLYLIKDEEARKDKDRQICIAGSDDKEISFGTSVSRNEFGIENGIFWSPDRKKVAFYRKDESLVTEFPLLDITTRTGSLKSIKYPMNGMDSERISLGIYDLESGKTVYACVADFGEDRYLTNISWGPDGKNIFILVVDRSQKHMHLNQYRSADGSFVRTLFAEDSDKYVEPLDPLHFIGDKYHFVYRTAIRDGYRNLYLCDTLGSVRRIAATDADLSFVRADENCVYYTSAEVSPSENHLFKVELKPAKGKKSLSAASTKIGKPVQITKERGWHRVVISEDGKYCIDFYSSFNVPNGGNIISLAGKKPEVICSEVAGDPLTEYKTGEVVLGTVKSADGKYDNWYRLFKPADFDPAKKYPVVLYVYGGPHSQMVQDKWLGGVRPWELLMAQKGYVVFVMDNRGTQNQGLEYEQAIHKHCGKAEMEDQMVGVNMLRSLPWVDSDRIGVHGWSYGGFMTISLMTTYPDVFKVGVAGGPVIDWKWYEIMYGERYMETMDTNPEGFAHNSLINKAKDLKGKLLICQGAIDNTCVWEHSLSFVQECINNNIQVDYFPYPRAEHNVIGPHRVHLMDKVTLYFDNNL